MNLLGPGHFRVFRNLSFTLSDSNTQYKCDDDMINSLLYDVWMTSLPKTVWTELSLPQKRNSADIDFAFLATRGGLIRFQDFSPLGNAKTIERDLSKFGGLFTADRYPLFYRRAAGYPPGTFVYSQSTNSRNRFQSFLRDLSCLLEYTITYH